MTHSQLVQHALVCMVLLGTACSESPKPIGNLTVGSKYSGDQGARTGDSSATQTSSNTQTTGAQASMQTASGIDTTTNTTASTTTTQADTQKFTPCVDQSDKCHPHRLIIGDFSLGKVIYVNLDDPSKDWDLKVPGGVRDLQLIGDNKVMVGTVDALGQQEIGIPQGDFGWHEVDIDTGKITKSVLGVTGSIMSAARLANGNTLLMGENILGGKGLVVVETNDTKKIISKKEFPGAAEFRAVRRSADGHFFVGSHTSIVEYSADGQEVWKDDLGSEPAYMALKLPSGERIAASGHASKIIFYDAKTGQRASSFTLPNIDSSANHMAAFAAGFLLLPNGNVVTTNWPGVAADHGKDGPQIAEYNREGKVVWSWKQQANRISGVVSVLVLDNLDLSKAHDDTNGPLAPVK